MSTTLPLCMSPVVGGPVSVMVTSLLQAITTMHCALTMPSVWPEDYGPTAVDEGLSNYDFVVIGGGTSGSVVASRLSEKPGVRVLVLEAGGDPPAESKIPAMFPATLLGPHIEGYSTEATSEACLGTSTQTCYFPIAKTLGGRSSIDHLMSFRGNKANFDEWNLPNWSWNEVSRYYNLSERIQSTRGYLVVNEFGQYDNCHISDMIFNGFRELGVNRLSPYVDSNTRVGIGFVKGHLKNGERVGAGESYLSVVKSRANNQVLKNAEVNEIEFVDGVVSRVKFVYNGNQEMTVGVDKEVILAAGPIGNAKLLMLSGIGPEDELTALDIPTVVNLPGVGKNLQDQIGVPVPFQQYKSKATPKTDKERQIDTLYYLTDRYGPLSTIGLLAQIGFINSDVSCAFKNCRYPDLNLLHFFSQRNDVGLKTLLDVIGYSDEISESLESANEEANLLLTFVSLQNPKSRGNLKLVSTNYLDKMEVHANYLQNAGDIESLLQGIKFVVKLQETKAYRKGKAEIIKLNIPACDHLTFKSDNYWRCYIKHMVLTMFAPSGTTKMGVDSDKDAVVDLRMKVRGVTGLRAVGSSIYSTAVSSTNTEVMVGERLAEFLKQDHSL